MIESLILSSLMSNEEYTRKVSPFLKSEYFQDSADRAIFDIFNDHFTRFNKLPTPTVVEIELGNKKNLSQSEFEKASTKLAEIPDQPGPESIEWLFDQTEAFCKDKALVNALMESIAIAEGGEKGVSRGAIPGILQNALAVSFDTNIGHDYFVNAEDRFTLYHKVESRIATHLKILNEITKGGFPKKTLNVFLAGTGVGKSALMCDLAANMYLAGERVLYISMEMAEERLAERIDANLLDTELDLLVELPRDTYFKKINRIKEKTTGQLVIKEYPTGSAGAANFRYLLQELRLKKNFVPTIIFIDYLNICCSSRLKMGNNVNSYTLIKSIAEELRGLAVEFDVPIISATQTNRSGFTNSDVGLDDTSESFGLPMTVDFMAALVSTEELEELGQIMWKQLKNRYRDVNKRKRFVTGIERAKMRFYDVSESAQTLIDDAPKSQKKEDKPAFDRSKFGDRAASGRKPARFGDLDFG